MRNLGGTVCKNCGNKYHNCMSCGNEYFMYDYCSKECVEEAGFVVCSKCHGFAYSCWDEMSDDDESEGCKGYVEKQK